MVEKIGGTLRLTKKYMMEDLYEFFVNILARSWPTTVHGWLDQQEDIRRRISSDIEAGRFGTCGIVGVDFRLYHADPGACPDKIPGGND